MPKAAGKALYRRILIKLSGEAMCEDAGFGISPEKMDRFAGEIEVLLGQADCQVALVIGAGNILRGSDLTAAGVDRVTADQIGMLGTVMNCLAMQDSLERRGMPARVMSAVQIHEVCEDYVRRRAIRHLERKRIVLFAAGLGNPFFTTDTAASLRAVEIGADLLIKATKVDGIYSGNPSQDRGARRYRSLHYDEVLERRLQVIDATAVVLCRDNDMPLRVIDMNRRQSFLRAVQGDDEGTLVFSAGRAS
ncbi:MAG: UMP kinase [Gammaproteobacteria bacterium]|nr:UMP kinase [Gammaproteobacteria bacterium]MDD9824441.1 UMP kinase [Gammaproteobacteria bacterium]MDD9863480.1 UMP kinase [Gammaproteobacteria bacterium]